MLKVFLHKNRHSIKEAAVDSQLVPIDSHEALIEIAEKAREIEHYISIITERKDVFFQEQDESFAIRADSKSVMEATLMVLMDKKVTTDFVFIHGSSVKDEKLDSDLLSLGAELLKSGQVKNIVINGLSSKDCEEKNIAYPGYDVWANKLQLLGVSNINAIAPSWHTAAESSNLVDFAITMGWNEITIMAFPHHLVRCMCQVVYFLKKKNATHIKVYARTFDTIDWLQGAVKPVLGTGKSINGTLFDHIEAEFQRIEKYMDPTGKGYTPHATLEEVIDYIKNREKVVL